jgi:hypothetical protein
MFFREQCYERARYFLEEARVFLGSARTNGPRHRKHNAAMLLAALEALLAAQYLREIAPTRPRMLGPCSGRERVEP